MKEIQDDLIPELSLLIKGEWNQIDPDLAKRIALWTAITSTVIAMSQPTLGVTLNDRRYIFNNKMIPKNWAVWIGRVSGVQELTYCNRIFTITTPLHDPLIPKEPNTLITTIELGKLLLHCVSVPHEILLPNSLSYGYNLGILPIHPWFGNLLPWQTIPILRQGSKEHRDVREFLYAAMFLQKDIRNL